MEQEQTEETEGFWLCYLCLLLLNAPKSAVLALTDGMFAGMDGTYAPIGSVSVPILGGYGSRRGVYGLILLVYAWVR